jgi:PII-like signaling protein
MRLMPGTFLRFYVHEHRRHGSTLLYEWLLEQARGLGIPGGSAFRAIAGYGRHGVLHEQRFFELAADLPVEVEFIVDDAQAAQLLELLRREGIDLVYARIPAEFGAVGNAAGREKTS